MKWKYLTVIEFSISYFNKMYLLTNNILIKIITKIPKLNYWIMKNNIETDIYLLIILTLSLNTQFLLKIIQNSWITQRKERRYLWKEYKLI